MTTQSRHLSLRGGSLTERKELVTSIALPPPLMPPVDAHSRLGGPYTAGSVIARAVVLDTLRLDRRLAERHDIEIRALVPDLRDAVPIRREALSESVPPTERTRIYPRLRTRRLAHGLTDLIRDYLTGLRGGGPYSLVIENLQDADPSDRELVAVLVRRLDASLLTVVACEASAPPRARGDLLGQALAAYAVRLQPPEGDDNRHRPADHAPAPDPAEEAALAARYVRGDGVSDDPALIKAYLSLSAPARARLHDDRGDELARSGAISARLGAVPYHRERGSDPAGAGVRALADAAEYCFAAGFHDAVAELCTRGRALTSAEAEQDHWWLFTSLAARSLAALGDGVAAQERYEEARAASTDPAVHRVAAYETAMLYARHHDPGRRDPARALPWINEAIAFAGLLADPAERAFNLAFMKNGRALIEMRLGRWQRALSLVDEALALADEQLPPGSHPLDRCSLLANRSRLLAGAGLPAGALEAQQAVLEHDPTYGEHHFDYGNLLHYLGRDDEALACYAKAEWLSLPFPELHYNRADILAARGDEGGALAELNRVIELDPDFLDAYVNRAGLLVSRGESAAAWADVNAGLARDSANPYLLCVLGQLEAGRGRTAPARAAFDAAIAARPDLVAAWAGRAALRLETGDPDGAAADLTRALELDEDAALLFNRATAQLAAGHLLAAKDDAERALKLRPDDPDTVVLLTKIAAAMEPPAG